MPTIRGLTSGAVTAAICAGGLFADAQAASVDERTVVRDGKVGYVMTEIYWAVYESADGKTECPHGYNDGPREQFKVLFPNDGKKRTIQETQLARESEIWFPSTSPEPYPFYEAQGTTAIGLNLDGKTGPQDFTSPKGEPGIDNQMYRAMGCIANYRGPDGTLYHFTNNYMQLMNYNRVLIELDHVDSLVNDPDVTLTIYRGRDGLLTDAIGTDFLAGGTQRVDRRWGKDFIRHFKGRIVDGVLTTDPGDLILPATAAFDDRTIQLMRAGRFQLKLTPDTAEGVLGGYTDVKTFYRQLNESWSTHHQSYGQESAPSFYRALQRLADAYPDATGHNTAISSAFQMRFRQAYIMDDQVPVMSADAGASPRGEAHR